jgi:predicted nucleic acid-binding protein
MAQHLLGENTLIDLCYKDTPAAAWLAGGVSAYELYTSVIAVAAARETIRAIANDQQRANLLENQLDQVITKLTKGGMSVLPFEKDDADAWARWRSHPLQVMRDGTLYDIGQDTRMIIATAQCGAFELVEPAEHYHAELRSLRMMVRSL